MKRKPVFGLLILSLFCFLLWQIWFAGTTTNPRSSNGRRPGIILTNLQDANPPANQQPIISEPASATISIALRDLPEPEKFPLLEREIIPRGNPLQQQTGDVTTVDTPDLLRYPLDPQRHTATLLQSFDGMDNISGYMPPDTVGEVGPNHYVQMINKSIAVYNKTGQLMAGPKGLADLWQGVGNCSQGGDPIVLYDSLADRWLLGQYAQPHHICIAISHTSDPSGNYYLYTYDTGSFPDYAKFGVWPDGYTMTANEGSYTAYIFDRSQMLNGSPAIFQKFGGQNNMLMPSDLDGTRLPPANSPNYFYTFKDDSFHGGPDRLEIFALDVDWQTPANSTFTLIHTIPIAQFTYSVCGFFNFDCIPQPGTGQRLDAISEWPMWRLQYRNFGSYETLVGNFTVDVGSDQAGIRWFELRKAGASPWQLYQEGTHAPDDKNYWLGSIAMDRAGNIAMGYSVSSNTLFPSIRYTTRQKSDPLGIMSSENVLVDGGGVQTVINRWGDYSSLNIDPVDDCTFWYTNEYYTVSSSTGWQTRIGSFRVSSCTIYEMRLPIIYSTTSEVE